MAVSRKPGCEIIHRTCVQPGAPPAHPLPQHARDHDVAGASSMSRGSGIQREAAARLSSRPPRPQHARRSGGRVIPGSFNAVGLNWRTRCLGAGTDPGATPTVGVATFGWGHRVNCRHRRLPGSPPSPGVPCQRRREEGRYTSDGPGMSQQSVTSVCSSSSTLDGTGQPEPGIR